MKKTYLDPWFKITAFRIVDVVAASGLDNGDVESVDENNERMDGWSMWQ